MGFLNGLFGRRTPPTIPPGPVVDVVQTWEMCRTAASPPCVVRYGRNAQGALTVDVQGDDPEAEAYLRYLLLDPHNLRPVHVEGVGPQRGPHTRDVELFERAMLTLPARYPALRTRRLS